MARGRGTPEACLIFFKSVEEQVRRSQDAAGKVVKLHWFTNRFYEDNALEKKYQRNSMSISLGKAKIFALCLTLFAILYQAIWFFQRIGDDADDDPNVEDDKFISNLVRLAAAGLLLVLTVYLWFFVNLERMDTPGVVGYMHRSWRGAIVVMIIIVCATQITYNYRVNVVRKRYALMDVADIMDRVCHLSEEYLETVLNVTDTDVVANASEYCKSTPLFLPN